MRGSPFLQTLLMVVAFLLAGVPVYRLTRSAADVAAAGSSAAENASTNTSIVQTAPLDVEAVFAPAPTDFDIKNLGQTVLAGHGPQARFQTRWTASVPTEGVDLVIQAHWPSPAAGETSASTTPGVTGPAAARITVRFVDGRVTEKSFWAANNGALEEVFTVPGAANAAPAL